MSPRDGSDELASGRDDRLRVVRLVRVRRAPARRRAWADAPHRAHLRRHGRRRVRARLDHVRGLSLSRPAMALDHLLTAREGPVLLITINRPGVLNALNHALIDDLHAEVRRAGDDREVRAIVVTGAGDRAFAAGAD